MGLNGLLTRLESRGSVTAVTAGVTEGETAEAPLTLDCTDVAPVTRGGKELRAAVDYDDRRYCDQCQNLTVHGTCLAARRREIVTMPTYHPLLDRPQRCEGYLPEGEDEDQRPGWMRWPWMVRTKELRKKAREAWLGTPVGAATENAT